MKDLLMLYDFKDVLGMEKEKFHGIIYYYLGDGDSVSIEYDELRKCLLLFIDDRYLQVYKYDILKNTLNREHDYD